MKLKVKAIFFDRVEDRYVYPERETVMLNKSPKMVHRSTTQK